MHVEIITKKYMFTSFLIQTYATLKRFGGIL